MTGVLATSYRTCKHTENNLTFLSNRAALLPQLRSTFKNRFEKLLGVGSEAFEGRLECRQ